MCPPGGAQEHTDFAEAQLQQRLIERSLEPREVDVLSVVAMAGATAEAAAHEEVIGQTADLALLQRIMLRRWARDACRWQEREGREGVGACCT